MIDHGLNYYGTVKVEDFPRVCSDTELAKVSKLMQGKEE